MFLVNSVFIIILRIVELYAKINWKEEKSYLEEKEREILLTKRYFKRWSAVVCVCACVCVSMRIIRAHLYVTRHMHKCQLANIFVVALLRIMIETYCLARCFSFYLMYAMYVCNAMSQYTPSMLCFSFYVFLGHGMNCVFITVTRKINVQRRKSTILTLPLETDSSK